MLLAAAGIRFEVAPPQCAEIVRRGESPEQFVERAALEKAFWVLKRHADHPLLAADTIVVLDQEIMGKPKNARHAEEMLQKLSGRTHTVITGMALIPKAEKQKGGRIEPRAVYYQEVKTLVTFRRFGPRLIRRYVASGDPLDKAGSYGIQGPGCALIDRIEGSYTNVIGLPLNELLLILWSEFGPALFLK
jgi:septum formation protein